LKAARVVPGAHGYKLGQNFLCSMIIQSTWQWW